MTVTVGIRGGLSVDHLVAVDRGSRFGVLGGPGLYAALGARLVAGARCSISTLLPDDDDRFQLLFEELAIDAAHSAPAATVPHVWILNSPEGRRIVDTRSSHGIELDDNDTAAAEGAGHASPEAFFAGIDGLLDSSPERRAPVAPDTVVGVDPHQVPLQQRGLDYLRDVVTAGAVLLPSRVQLSLIDPDPRRAAQSLLDHLQRPVIARLDSEGMYVVTAQGHWSLVDDAVEVVETTGAGDSSAAAIVAALTLGHDYPTAAAFGMSVARWALADWGHQGLIHREPLTRPLSTITITREA